MKKMLIILCLAIGHYSATSQVQETTYKFVRLQNGEFHRKDRIIGGYADSLNFWKPNGKLPRYIFKKELDFVAPTLKRLKMDDSSWLLSLRVAILQRVYNESVLEYIVQLKDDRLDQLYKPEDYPHKWNVSEPYEGPGPNIFWMDYSWRRLVQQRLDDLRRSKSKFEK